VALASMLRTNTSLTDVDLQSAGGARALLRAPADLTRAACTQ
jgi:hypothetical protein